jgi:hypothetical protein
LDIKTINKVSQDLKTKFLYLRCLRDDSNLGTRNKGGGGKAERKIKSIEVVHCWWEGEGPGCVF